MVELEITSAMYRYIDVFQNSGNIEDFNVDVRCFLFTHDYLAG